jgi:hypothetical protein
MQKELHRLVARQRELTRRIRSVHRVVRGLGEIVSVRAVSSPDARPQPSNDDGTIAGPQPPQASGIAPPSDAVNVDLLRACRIALMEAQTAVSLEEIYERIARRGSFSFMDIDHARLRLRRVLNVMAQASEVRLLENDPSNRWERILQATECTGPFQSTQSSI